MMVVMVIVPVVMAVTVPSRRPAAAHGDAARFAKLRRLRFHASRDPRHVGDDVRTKSHRIGRARLARGVTDLGDGAIETTEKQGEHDNGACQVNDPHAYPLGLATLLRG